MQQQEGSNAFRFHFVQYASRRAADWKARGFTETLVDFPTLNARSKFWGDDQRAAFKNWEEIEDIRNTPLGGRQGIDERIMLRELLRRVDMMVIYENHLDALVRLHTPLPPGKIGGALGRRRPRQTSRRSVRTPARPRCSFRPATSGRRTTRRFALSADGKRYMSVNSNTPTDGARAWTAVLAGVPRRGRQGGRDPEGGLRVSERVEAASAAAGVSSARGPATDRHDGGAVPVTPLIGRPSR